MDSLVENGRRLFDFLAALQKSKENPVEKRETMSVLVVLYYHSTHWRLRIAIKDCSWIAYPGRV